MLGDLAFTIMFHRNMQKRTIYSCFKFNLNYSMLLMRFLNAFAMNTPYFLMYFTSETKDLTWLRHSSHLTKMHFGKTYRS